MVSVMVDPAAVRAFLERLGAALANQRVRFTWKADDEIADLGWSDLDAYAELDALRAADFLRTEPSRSHDFTIIWVFCPLASELQRHLWIRLAEVPGGAIVISFHLAERDPWT
jgi:hypothetical protein